MLNRGPHRPHINRFNVTPSNLYSPSNAHRLILITPIRYFWYLSEATNIRIGLYLPLLLEHKKKQGVAKMSTLWADQQHPLKVICVGVFLLRKSERSLRYEKLEPESRRDNFFIYTVGSVVRICISHFRGVPDSCYMYYTVACTEYSTEDPIRHTSRGSLSPPQISTPLPMPNSWILTSHNHILIFLMPFWGN